MAIFSHAPVGFSNPDSGETQQAVSGRAFYRPHSHQARPALYWQPGEEVHLVYVEKVVMLNGRGAHVKCLIASLNTAMGKRVPGYWLQNPELTDFAMEEDFMSEDNLIIFIPKIVEEYPQKRNPSKTFGGKSALQLWILLSWTKLKKGDWAHGGAHIL